MKRFVCYTTDPEPLELVPARGDRTWMDDTPDRFAYRCLPLSMANSTGWELLNPIGFSATWNGSIRQDGITLQSHNPAETDKLQRLALSHFGSGVLTFHTGWLFHTPPGWAMQARGAPNWIKDGIQALDGLVETDWLPFPFTMNWKFTRPGTVSFEVGEPLCYILPLPHGLYNDIQPLTTAVGNNPELYQQYQAWGTSRASFLQKLEDNDESTRKQGWQRFYMHGKDADGLKVGTTHLTKRKLKTPRAATEDDFPNPPTP